MTAATQIAAGRELDELVAAEVMGWDRPRPDREFKPHAWFAPDGWSDDPRFRAFSTTYEGMGLVLERMQALGAWRRWVSYENAPNIGGWSAAFSRTDSKGKHVERSAIAATLPHAVALAALAAVRA